MKYAFMSFSAPGYSLDELLALASRIGYDGIEPREGHAHGIEPLCSHEQRRSIRQRSEDAGVEICCLALGDGFADPAKAAEAVENVRRYIDLARDIGCTRLRVFGGLIPEGVTREKAADSITHSLAGIAPEAHSAGVYVCMETHDDWTHPDHVAGIMRCVDNPHIAVNWDMMHPTRTSLAPMGEAFCALRPWIRHVHIHDGLLSEPLQLRPFGNGELDMISVFRSLLSINYDGYISGEWIRAEEIIDIAEELRRMRALEQQLRA